MVESSSNELTIKAVLLHYGAKRVPDGSGWKAMRCPFHSDSQASASVSQSKNAFKCHGCQMSGDPIAIIRKVEKITRREAVEQARQVFDACVEDVPPSVSRQRQRRKLGRERWQDLLG